MWMNIRRHNNELYGELKWRNPMPTVKEKVDERAGNAKRQGEAIDPTVLELLQLLADRVDALEALAKAGKSA